MFMCGKFFGIGQSPKKHGDSLKMLPSYVSYSLNSLKGAYIGDSIGDYYGSYWGDSRSLDYSSCA